MKRAALNSVPSPSPRRAPRPAAEERPLEVELVLAEADDPEVLERVIDAIADVLSGRVG